MGVFIYLDINPDRISAEDWKSVYQETLVLLDKFPFLDAVPNENGYCYAQPSAHRKNVIGEYAGWETCGDMMSGNNMESFFLIDDIEFYRAKGGGGWHGKTQGMPAHIPLLAIGCLICHRFPDAANVSGDISASQCRYAVEWANECLELVPKWWYFVMDLFLKTMENKTFQSVYFLTDVPTSVKSPFASA